MCIYQKNGRSFSCDVYYKKTNFLQILQIKEHQERQMKTVACTLDIFTDVNHFPCKSLFTYFEYFPKLCAFNYKCCLTFI